MSNEAERAGPVPSPEDRPEEVSDEEWERDDRDWTSFVECALDPQGAAAEVAALRARLDAARAERDEMERLVILLARNDMGEDSVDGPFICWASDWAWDPDHESGTGRSLDEIARTRRWCIAFQKGPAVTPMQPLADVKPDAEALLLRLVPPVTDPAPALGGPTSPPGEGQG